MKLYNNDQIVNEVKSILKIESDKELAESLGVSKQSIWQFRQPEGIATNQRIMSTLINIIKERDKKSGTS